MIKSGTVYKILLLFTAKFATMFIYFLKKQRGLVMIKENMEFLKSLDPEVGAAVIEEYNRQRNGLELIASEIELLPVVD